MSQISKPKAVFFTAVLLFFIWFSSGFFVEIVKLINQLWIWRPASVIGLLMIICPIILAFPINYFLNVKRTSNGGVIKVTGFFDYIGHGILNLATTWLLSGSIIAGFFILFFG